MSSRRSLLIVFAAALLLRLICVLWAPNEPAADGIFYKAYGGHIARGWGYVDLDGSPVVRWMPGWPYLLGALYRLFGSNVAIAPLANAFLDATTAALLVGLGRRLFRPLVGVLAGGFYAVWPGMVFLCATHMSEPLFNLLLVATLYFAASACDAGAHRGARAVRAAATGLCLGAAALVKAEPLVVLPAIWLALWRTRASPADFWRGAAAAALLAAAVLTPWTIRNYVAFDRLLPTAASGGIGIYLANHPGATGGQDLRANRALQQRFQRETAAATSIARNDAGWRDAWDFVRAHPAEELRIVANKLRITYAEDSRGAKLIRGLGPREDWHLGDSAWRWMRNTANTWWFVMLALSGVGLTTWRGWKPATAPLLLLGVLLPWLCLQIIFLGGPRYHVPQIPALALLAACGTDRLIALSRRRKQART